MERCKPLDGAEIEATLDGDDAPLQESMDDLDDTLRGFGILDCDEPGNLGWNQQDKLVAIDYGLSPQIKKDLPLYIAKYGQVKFGMMEIPIELAKAEVFKGEIAEVYSSFEEYQKWYTAFDMPNHTRNNRWPCILSSYEDELFQDGWHRFARYYQLNCPTIPCIYYVKN